MTEIEAVTIANAFIEAHKQDVADCVFKRAVSMTVASGTGRITPPWAVVYRITSGSFEGDELTVRVDSVAHEAEFMYSL